MKTRRKGFGMLAMCAGIFIADVFAQEGGAKNDSEMSLRKLIEVRDYRGQPIEGETRVIGPGDSLWRILIQEKGLSEKKFNRYLVVLRGLNPQIKSFDLLKVGENVFVPIQLDEALAGPTAMAQTSVPARQAFGNGSITEYRVKRGNYLYQILREQLGINDEGELAVYFALVKDLNPQRSNWDVLEEGEILRLPTVGANNSVVAKSETGVPQTRGKTVQSPQNSLSPEQSISMRRAIPLDYARRLPARKVLALLEQVANTLDSEVYSEGQEIVALKEGIVRLDRSAYPVLYNPKVRQRVILDTGEQIPRSLRKSIDSPETGMSVLPLAESATLDEAVGQLLGRLGFQAFPNDRPVVLQQGGIGMEAKGTWMALAPEESGKAQEFIIITLTDKADEIPQYLREQFAANGVHLKDVLLPSYSPAPSDRRPQIFTVGTKTWPREKTELVDALLRAHDVVFGMAETLSVQLREGLRIEIPIDRVFDSKGKRRALFFRRLEPEIKKSLHDRHELQPLELELSSLSSKEIIARMLAELGEQSAYREHRFAAVSDGKDRLTISARGFLLRNRPMFLTDQHIPISLHRFFFEKRLEIVYFQ